MSEESVLKKIKNFKHKELLCIIVIIIALVAVWYFGINKKSDTPTQVDLTQMSTEEILSYQIKEAVNAISGDEDSKIVIVWDTTESNSVSTSVSLGSLFKDNNESLECRKISGVAVVCKNGDDAKTKVEIMMMLSSSLGVDINKISVNGKK